MVSKKKILASVSVLLVAMLVGAAITNAIPVLEPVQVKVVRPPPQVYSERIYSEMAEAGAYARIISYDNFAKSGETIVVKGSVQNYGDSEITVELVPIMREEEEYKYRYRGNVIKPEWVSVNPSENLGAGASANFDISVSIPSGTKSGYYSGMIAIRTDKYPERIEHYSVQVYKPLEEPITKEFRVAPNSTKVMVTVKWNKDEKNLISTEGTVDVHLFDPYGNEVSQKTKMTKISGYVDAFNYALERGIGIDIGDEETTNVHVHVHVHGQQAVIYQIENPASGTWKLEMMPENVMHFNYDIVVNPIEDMRI